MCIKSYFDTNAAVLEVYMVVVYYAAGQLAERTCRHYSSTVTRCILSLHGSITSSSTRAYL